METLLGKAHNNGRSKVGTGDVSSVQFYTVLQKTLVLLEDSLGKSITTQYTYSPPPRHMVPPGVRQERRHHTIFSLLLLTDYLVLQME